MQNFRHERIVQTLIQDINTLIVLKKIKDPRVSSRVSVLHVKLSKDFTDATVYVSSYLQDETLLKTVHALNHAKGYIQSEIHKKNRWRHTPRLLFKSSDGLKKGEQIISSLTQKEEEMFNADALATIDNPTKEDDDTFS